MEHTVNLSVDNNSSEEIDEILETNLNSEERLIGKIKASLQSQDSCTVDTNPKREKSKHQQRRGRRMGASSNPSSRMALHRPSVRSISETPNVIGATRITYTNDACTYLLIGMAWAAVVVFFPVSFLFIFRVVQEYERAVIFRLGRLRKG